MKKPTPPEGILWSGSPSLWLDLKWHALLVLALVAAAGCLVVSFMQVGAQAPVMWRWMALACLIVLPVWWWQVLVLTHTHYELTPERIIIRTGVLNITTNELELYRVRDYQVQQPLILRLVGLGTLALLTFDQTNRMVVVPGVRNVQALRETVRVAVENCPNRRGIRQVDVV